ncbi:MAG: hypothetical protein K2W95_30090 [Candidatus Obscuribacterales bacterium]|nr:hypothetical protein [Candidatus Obscuribacterales bacterium]
MLTQGAIYAFINFEQAARFGHIGWGFLQEDGTNCLFGSSDHLYHHNVWDLPAWIKYMAVPPGGDIDWWCESGTEEQMLRAMRTGRNTDGGRHIFYHAYKVILVPSPDPARAKYTAEHQQFGGWEVLANNCVHHAYQIFADYGAAATIPNPSGDPFHRIPKRWFNLLAGAPQSL